ncbi:CvpA family protein [Candidatus Chlorohelix sp.]|uniref:CvpA family protein n=1 Tax=Candidatus Chlorohelix sp. TaxID=3139201 RepID=UPI003035A067
MGLVIDFILLLVILLIAFMGFNMGLVKIGTGIFGMYLGIQIATYFYSVFAGLTATASNPTSVATNQIVWFFTLWIVWSIIFTLILWSFTKTIYIPKRLASLDQLGGLTLGMFAGIFGLFVIAFVVRNMVMIVWLSTGQPNNYSNSILEGFNNSIIFGILRSLRYVYLNILSPWLPVSQIPVFKDNPLFG